MLEINHPLQLIARKKSGLFQLYITQSRFFDWAATTTTTTTTTTTNNKQVLFNLENEF